MSKNHRGIAHLAIILAVFILAVVGFAGWRLYSSKTSEAGNSNYQIKSSGGKGQKVSWTLTENGWKASGELPQCPNPLIKFPVDLGLVTSMLYPGQYRGGDYKPHGGFRFDKNESNNVAVTAPMDAEVIRGARYPVSGETQYVFDFVAPCGYMYRFGHLLTLSPKLQAIADKLPQNSEGDSRDSAVNPLDFQAGETMATAVGLTKGGYDGGINVFLDWGMYDLRTKNEASKDAAWAAKHPGYTEQYAVCWLDLLNADEETKVRALPSADGSSGKSSDYCK